MFSRRRNFAFFNISAYCVFSIRSYSWHNSSTSPPGLPFSCGRPLALSLGTCGLGNHENAEWGDGSFRSPFSGSPVRGASLCLWCVSCLRGLRERDKLACSRKLTLRLDLGWESPEWLLSNGWLSRLSEPSSFSCERLRKLPGAWCDCIDIFFFARCDAPRNFDAAIIFLIETFAGMLRSLDSERLRWKVCLLSSFGLWLVLSLLCSSTLNSALPGLGLEVWGTVAWQPSAEKLSEETERWNLVCRFSLDFEESSTSSWWRASGVAVWGQTWERIESNLVPTLQIDLSRL